MSADAIVKFPYRFELTTHTNLRAYAMKVCPNRKPAPSQEMYAHRAVQRPAERLRTAQSIVNCLRWAPMSNTVGYAPWSTSRPDMFRNSIWRSIDDSRVGRCHYCHKPTNQSGHSRAPCGHVLPQNSYHWTSAMPCGLQKHCSLGSIDFASWHSTADGHKPCLIPGMI